MKEIKELKELTTTFESVMYKQIGLVAFNIGNDAYRLSYEPESNHKTVLSTVSGEKIFNDPVDAYIWISAKYYGILANNQDY